MTRTRTPPARTSSTERTFSEHPHLIHDRGIVLAILRELTESLSEDLVAKGLYTNNIGIKWKTVDFEVCTRAETLPAPIQSAAKMHDVIQRLVERHAEDEWVRLLGVRASGLTDEPAPQTILDFEKGSAQEQAKGWRLDAQCATKGSLHFLKMIHALK